MKTYYSIIYYGNNNNERINCGLILFNEEFIFIKLNNAKILFAKKLLGEAYWLFKGNLIKMADYFTANKTTYTEIEKLSRYMNNMTRITTPMIIAINCTHENFDKLFDEMI